MLKLDSLVRRYHRTNHRWRFKSAARRIFRTPPAGTGRDPLSLVSMVHHRDVGPYLLAAKSLLRVLSPRRIVVVMDATMTPRDMRVLAEHIRGIEFLRAEDCRDSRVPEGGCGERLLAISDLAQDDFTVQIDADTVTLDRLPEVESAIGRGESFVLGTEDHQAFVGCDQAAKRAQGRPVEGRHVQVHCEANLDRLPSAPDKR